MANECTHTYMTYIWQIYTIYIYLYIYVQLALRIHGCLRVTVSRKMCYVYLCEMMKWWENDDISVMRIARYCTSVLISGRTIPVDVNSTTSFSFFLGSRAYLVNPNGCQLQRWTKDIAKQFSNSRFSLLFD